MTDYIVSKVATYAAVFTSNSGAVYGDIDANPGTSRADIAVRTGKSAVIVDAVIAVALEARIVVRGYNVAGLEFFWTSPDWTALILANLGAARTWLASNDNGLVSVMAPAIGVHQAVAIDLARILVAEGTAKVTLV